MSKEFVMKPYCIGETYEEEAAKKVYAFRHPKMVIQDDLIILKIYKEEPTIYDLDSMMMHAEFDMKFTVISGIIVALYKLGEMEWSMATYYCAGKGNAASELVSSGEYKVKIMMFDALGKLCAYKQEELSRSSSMALGRCLREQKTYLLTKELFDYGSEIIFSDCRMDNLLYKSTLKEL